uniref:Uncharacterized protein n=1 Tax=Oryza brachyantha TaxID=4533 RepID=J3LM80_ORYBR
MLGQIWSAPVTCVDYAIKHFLPCPSLCITWPFLGFTLFPMPSLAISPSPSCALFASSPFLLLPPVFFLHALVWSHD